MSIAEKEGTVTIQEAEYAELRRAVAKLEVENKRLSDELAILLSRFFRKKSERLDPNQLRLFLEELQGAPVEPRRLRPRSGRQRRTRRPTVAPDSRHTCRARRSSSTYPKKSGCARIAASR